jgi:hypothetical protein
MGSLCDVLRVPGYRLGYAPEVSLTLRHVAATRYVLPLREGGSLPGLVEADDLGMYVVKFHGAGQGPKVLVAEVVVGELARALGMPVPEIVVVEMDPRLAPAEPDQEVQDLLRASPGENLGLDYLPGSLGFEPAVDRIDPELAAQVLWLDGLTDNVDRTWRNPNLLTWHRRPWLIDHGAALYWQHHWATREGAITRPLRTADEHVLLRRAAPLRAVDPLFASLVTRGLLADILAVVPDAWLGTEPDAPDPAAVRAAYVDLLVARLGARASWLEPLEVARAAAV